MRGLQKSKGVTWASDGNLCQVKLFLSEESPSQIASSAQDHLQAKAAWDPVSNGMMSDENLPPGFEGTQSAYAWTTNLSQIPLIKWKFPPKYVINDSWRVVAGDESEEVKTQSKREMSILEAIYPRSIPSDPEYVDAEEVSSENGEKQCPLIPITCVEDEDVISPEIQNDSTSSSSSSSSSFDPNFLAAAQSALSMFMKNNNQANNIIDSELLMKVLRDPKLIEQLARNQGMNLHLPNNVSRPELVPPPVHGSGFYSQPPNAPPPPPPISPVVTKDVNYYKSLIQQHGGERPDSTNSGVVHSNNNQQFVAATSGGGFRQRDLKQKIMKPCIYFNTSRGCRNGENCAYQHDGSSKQRINSNNNNNQDSQNANKRMKLEREITGI